MGEELVTNYKQEARDSIGRPPQVSKTAYYTQSEEKMRKRDLKLLRKTSGET